MSDLLTCLRGMGLPLTENAADEIDRLESEIDRLTRELAEAKARAGSANASLPDGWVAVPARLTAESGAKGALIGEFYEAHERECPVCDEIDDDETCDVCEGSGIVVDKVPVSWTTIKEVHARVVELLSARPELPPNGLPNKEPSDVE